jgi:CO/xanthine dehydrogenase FAD-binding subunit
VYLRPATLRQACEALAARRLTVLAGGTDHFPARVGVRRDEDLLDLTGIAELRGIAKGTAGWRIGATTTWTDLVEAPLPPLFDGLKLAAREVGGVQIQNTGTVAGNLCNASPAADGVPALLAMDASVELASAAGSRMLSLPEFITAPRRTQLEPGELVAAIHIPLPRHAAYSHFLKLGARRYLLISIAMVAVVLEVERRTVRSARIAVGSCSPVALRLTALERELAGKKLDGKTSSLVAPLHFSGLRPIDDVRASAAYRLEAAATLVRRALDELAERA